MESALFILNSMICYCTDWPETIANCSLCSRKDPRRGQCHRPAYHRYFMQPYENSDSWKTTICYSVISPDGVASDLVERITATVLSSVYAATQLQTESEKVEDNKKQLVWLHQSISSGSFYRHAAHNMVFLRVKERFFWWSTLWLKRGIEVSATYVRESTMINTCPRPWLPGTACQGQAPQATWSGSTFGLSSRERNFPKVSLAALRWWRPYVWRILS